MHLADVFIQSNLHCIQGRQQIYKVNNILWFKNIFISLLLFQKDESNFKKIYKNTEFIIVVLFIFVIFIIIYFSEKPFNSLN